MKTLILTALLCTVSYYATGVLIAKSDTIKSIQTHNAKIELALK